MRDLYSILGVRKSSSGDDIKKAYKKLAKQHHPDRNQGNAAATEKFKEVSAAYAILGDEERRAKYDRGEINEQGQETGFARAGAGGGYGGGHGGARAGGNHAGAGGFGFGDGDFRFTGSPDDIFERMFGGLGGRGSRSGFGGRRAPKRGEDIQYQITVGFLDAALGATRRLNLQSGKSLDVKIPAGLENGQQIRLSGQGQAGENGAPAGDALIRVSVADHPFFRRDGRDIHLDLPITLGEAVLGAKIDVPTLDGSVALKIPKGASSGQTLRLKEKGIAAKAGTGDLYVHLLIKLPRTDDPDFERAVDAWTKKHSHDPRAHLKR